MHMSTGRPIGRKIVSLVTTFAYLFTTLSSCFADMPYMECDGHNRIGSKMGIQAKPIRLDDAFQTQDHQSDWVFKVSKEGEDIHFAAYERFAKRGEKVTFIERFSSTALKKDAGLAGEIALQKTYDNFSKNKLERNQLHLSVGWDGTLRIKGLQAQQQKVGFESFGAIEFEEGLKAQEVVTKALKVINKAPKSKVQRFDVWGLEQNADPLFINREGSNLKLQELHLHKGQMRNEGKLKFKGDGLINLQDHRAIDQPHALLGKIKARNLTIESQAEFDYDMSHFDVPGLTTFQFAQAVTLDKVLKARGALLLKGPQVTVNADVCLKELYADTPFLRLNLPKEQVCPWSLGATGHVDVVAPALDIEAPWSADKNLSITTQRDLNTKALITGLEGIALKSGGALAYIENGLQTNGEVQLMTKGVPLFLPHALTKIRSAYLEAPAIYKTAALTAAGGIGVVTDPLMGLSASSAQPIPEPDPLNINLWGALPHLHQAGIIPMKATMPSFTIKRSLKAI